MGARTTCYDEKHGGSEARRFTNLDGSSFQMVPSIVKPSNAKPSSAASKQLENSCASHVRMRTTLPKPFSLSPMIGPDLH
jgi:hypothetical protein